MQEFDTIFDYTFQERLKQKILNINNIQSKYGISIDQTYHIMKNSIQEYWVTNTKYEVKFHQSLFPVDISFEKKLWIYLSLEKSWNKLIDHMEDH